MFHKLSIFTLLFAIILPDYAVAAKSLCTVTQNDFVVERNYTLPPSASPRRFVRWNRHNFIFEEGKFFRFDLNSFGPTYSFQTTKEQFLGTIGIPNSQDKFILTSTLRGLGIYRWQESTALLSFRHELQIESRRSGKNVFSPTVDIIQNPRKSELLLLGLFSILRLNIEALIREDWAQIIAGSQNLIGHNQVRSLAFHYSPRSLEPRLQNRLYIIVESERTKSRSAVQYYDLLAERVQRDFQNRPFPQPAMQYPYLQRLRLFEVNGNSELNANIQFALSNDNSNFWYNHDKVLEIGAPIVNARILDHQRTVLFLHKHSPILLGDSDGETCTLGLSSISDIIPSRPGQFWMVEGENLKKVRVRL